MMVFYVWINDIYRCVFVIYIYIYIYVYIGMQQICKYTWKWRQIWKCANYVANGSLLRLFFIHTQTSDTCRVAKVFGKKFSL